MSATAAVLPNLYLPSSLELPSSDDTPVDNEDQNFIPNFLLFLLENIWAERQDWYFGVDMGVYYNRKKPVPPIVPDAFLSLGVQRRKSQGRLSYVFWEERDIAPSFVLEMVSHNYGSEYENKAAIYARLGVLYYLIYNPNYWQRHNKKPFELYKLIDGSYEHVLGEPYFMPEIGLGIGRFSKGVRGVSREVLYWYDSLGNRYKDAEEQLGYTKEQLTSTENQYKDLQSVVNTSREEGFFEGQAVGFNKGVEKGAEERALEIAKNLKAKGLSNKEVAELAGLNLADLEDL